MKRSNCNKFFVGSSQLLLNHAITHHANQFAGWNGANSLSFEKVLKRLCLFKKHVRIGLWAVQNMPMKFFAQHHDMTSLILVSGRETAILCFELYRFH